MERAESREREEVEGKAGEIYRQGNLGTHKNAGFIQSAIPFIQAAFTQAALSQAAFTQAPFIQAALNRARFIQTSRNIPQE